MANILQLKRNGNLYENKAAAKIALEEQFGLTDTRDGEAIIARYKDGNDVATLLGVYYKKKDGDGSGNVITYSIFDSKSTDSIQQTIEQLMGGTPDANYDTIKEISDALVKINGAETVDGSIRKALADAKQDSLNKINALDKDDTAKAKNFVTAVSEENGIITVERGAVTSDSTITITDNTDGGIGLAVNMGSIVDGTTITLNNNKLSLASALNVQYEGKDAIAVGSASDGKKELSLKIDTNDKVLTQGANGLLTNIDLTWNSADGLKLIGKGGNVLKTIPATDFIKDGMLDNVELKQATASEPIAGLTTGTFLVFTFNADSGKQVINLNVTDLIDVYTGGNGITVNGKAISAKVKTSDKYLEVTADGIASKDIDTAISNTITTTVNGLNVAPISEAGKYISEVSENNGLIRATLKQVEASEVKLSEIGEASANGVKLAATTVQDGIAELFTKILDNEEVEAEAINKVKTALGIAGEELKYEPKTGDTIIGSAKSYSEADTKLSSAIKSVQDQVITVQAGDGVTVSGTGATKTIAVKVPAGDKFITVDATGIHTKEDIVFDCGTY